MNRSSRGVGRHRRPDAPETELAVRAKEWAEDTANAQGLPSCVEDMSVIGEVAILLASGRTPIRSRPPDWLDAVGVEAIPAPDGRVDDDPGEDGVVRVSRARGSITYPVRFVLVVAMNPCPCGDGGAPGSCRCSPALRASYARGLFGPLLDRFDIAIRVDRPTTRDPFAPRKGEGSVEVAARVLAARVRAEERGVTVNAHLSAATLDDWVPLDGHARDLLDRDLRTGRLRARGLHRVRRLARTVADLDFDLAGLSIAVRHVAEGLFLRGSRSLVLGEAVQ